MNGSLARLTRLIDHLSVTRASNDGIFTNFIELFKKDPRVPSQYQLLAKETDSAEDEYLVSVVKKISDVLENLDAGGTSLSSVAKKMHPQLSLLQWILTIDIWGSFFCSFFDEGCSSLARSVDSLKKGTKVLESILSNAQNEGNPLIKEICKDVDKVYTCLIKLLNQMQERSENLLSESQVSMISSQGMTARTTLDYQKAGHLLTLTCGHSGSYSTTEKSLYEKHLINVNFISSK